MPCEVADAVAVRVLERARIDLVDDAALPPRRSQACMALRCWRWHARIARGEPCQTAGGEEDPERTKCRAAKVRRSRRCGTPALQRMFEPRCQIRPSRPWHGETDDVHGAGSQGERASRRYPVGAELGRRRRRLVPGLGARPRAASAVVFEDGREHALEPRGGRLLLAAVVPARGRRPLPLPPRRRRGRSPGPGVALPARGPARPVAGRRPGRLSLDGRRAGAGVGDRGARSIYEMHVGTFTPEGTWAAAASKLPHLKDLGVTAHRDDAGQRVSRAASAGATTASTCSRRPGSTARRTTCAPSSTRRTRLGIGVILDVVYNHFGPDGNYLGPVQPGLLHATARERLGRGDQLRRPGLGGRARVLRRQRGLLDRRVPLRRAAARRHAEHPRRLATTTSSRRSSARPARRPGAARHRADRRERAAAHAARRARRPRAATASTRSGTTTSTTPPWWR